MVKFFDIQNLVRSLKVLGAGIISSLILLFPSMLVRFLMEKQFYGVSIILGFILFVGNLFLFGFLLNKFYRWR